MSRILLHACCGPCSLEPVRLLRSAGFEPVIFYSNANISPAEEYHRRLATLKEWAGAENIEVIEGAYDPERWEKTVGSIGDKAHSRFGVITQEEGDRGATQTVSEARIAREARCRACYRLRFQEAAAYGQSRGFSTLGTTLSVSPYQYTTIIAEELTRAAENAGVAAHFEDYRPFYPAATKRSRDLGMYRQNYCGCRFSDEEAEREREERRAARRAAREAEKAASTEKREALEKARAQKRAERQAYAEAQAKKRALRKALRNAERSSSSLENSNEARD